MTRLSRRSFVGAVALAPVVALGACSTGPSEDTAAAGSGASTSAAADAFPVTIEHALGETTIEKAPTKIATVGWSDQDVVASFGVVPVGAPAITWGGNKDKSTDWFDAAVDEIDPDAEIVRYDDADGVPVDEIAKLAPDLVLGVNSGMSQDEYDKLTKIAPTVAYPGAPWGTSWEDSVEFVGKALGQEDKATQITDDLNADIDEAVAKYPEIKGKSAAWIWFTPTDLSTIGVYASTDLRPQMLERFGMTEPDFVTKGSKDGAFSFELSSERSTDVDADLVVFYVEEDGQVEKLKKDPLLGKIPALKDDHYVGSADNATALSMSSPTPLSLPVALEDFLPKLASAAEGKPAS
ncbi:ABC transporter substrate-binding protein [Janibacter sp. Y6]|uniref:ABC transporter substrate-binding protein n=1 Tax=Janibacter sp. Y6 TaxID=2913552 RepID=UPI0034A45E6A